jgi:hypothetical protein
MDNPKWCTWQKLKCMLATKSSYIVLAKIFRHEDQNHNEHFCIKYAAFDSDSKKEFIAITHVWGDVNRISIPFANTTWDIPLNSMFKDNFKQTLKDLSSTCELIWLDVICIPQEFEGEDCINKKIREDALRTMNKVYRKAKQVIAITYECCLYKSICQLQFIRESKEGYDDMKKLQKQYGNEKVAEIIHSDKIRAFKHLCMEQWPENGFFSNKWCQRVWTLQEFRAAKEIMLYHINVCTCDNCKQIKDDKREQKKYNNSMSYDEALCEAKGKEISHESMECQLYLLKICHDRYNWLVETFGDLITSVSTKQWFDFLVNDENLHKESREYKLFEIHKVLQCGKRECSNDVDYVLGITTLCSEYKVPDNAKNKSLHFLLEDLGKQIKRRGYVPLGYLPRGMFGENKRSIEPYLEGMSHITPNTQHVHLCIAGMKKHIFRSIQLLVLNEPLVLEQFDDDHSKRLDIDAHVKNVLNDNSFEYLKGKEEEKIWYRSEQWTTVKKIFKEICDQAIESRSYQTDAIKNDHNKSAVQVFTVVQQGIYTEMHLIIAKILDVDLYLIAAWKIVCIYCLIATI